ncbi:MAG: GntR family transcriptional regulator [Microthrixaceae bacterium]
MVVVAQQDSALERHGAAPRPNMIAVEIDESSPVPVFEQLRAQIERSIRTGHLLAGRSLPTVRQLAADLAIAPNTVGRAYRELEQAGLIRTQGRRGTTVKEPPPLSVAERRGRLTTAAQRLLDEAALLGWSADETLAELRRLTS